VRLAFALTGSGYLLLVTCTIFAPLRDSLLTSRALNLAARALNVPTSVILRNPSGDNVYDLYGSSKDLLDEGSGVASYTAGARPNDIPIVAFFRIGQCVWSWFFGLLAAWSAGWIYASRETPKHI
jgi:hypothetical protein